MRFSIQLLRCAAFVTFFLPTSQAAATPTQNPSFFEESRVLLAQTESSQNLAQADDRQTEAAQSFLLQGIQQWSNGNIQGVITALEGALEIYQATGNLRQQGYTLNALGVAHNSFGQYAQSIRFYEEALSVARELGNSQGEGLALISLGNVYSSLGQYQQTIDLSQQAISVFQEAGFQHGETAALVLLSSTYNNLGQSQQAIEVSQQALLIFQELAASQESDGAVVVQQGEAVTLATLGRIHGRLRQPQEAISFLQQALAMYRELSNHHGEQSSLLNLGWIYAYQGKYQEALDLYQQSLEISRELGYQNGEASTLRNQGFLLTVMEQLPQAESALYQSIEAFESLRTDLSDDQLISIVDTQTLAYNNLQFVLAAQAKFEEALAITERGRGRAFVLQLASRLATEERAELEATPVAQVPTVAEIQQIARDTNTTLVTYSLIGDLALYIWVVQPTGEIEFRGVEFEGGEGDLAINPIASIDGSLYRGTPEPSELDTLVADSRSALIESTDSNATPTEKLQELHQLLIDPIADLLPGDPNAQVAFIPQGELFLVPFAALQDEDGTYLIEKHTILTAPSIQVFGLANAARPETRDRRLEPGMNRQNALVVGNPTMPRMWLPTDSGLAEAQLSNLPGARAEAEAIANFFEIPALTGAAATEATVKQQLPNASLIHLATHGLLEYGIPESSGVLDVPGAIALAPGDGEDGLLTSAEILEMDLQADLAILSACDTGRGRITGDGVVGLSRAFITAGVPSVMVSLWAVNDDSTSLLMQRFYEFLATGDITKAQALRQAQLSLLYDEDVETRLDALRAGAPPQYQEGFEPVGDRHPYHWAPFVLMGNGR